MLEIQLKEEKIVIRNGLMSFFEEERSYHIPLKNIKNVGVQDFSTKEKYEKRLFINRIPSPVGSSAQWGVSSYDKKTTEQLNKLFTAILENPSQEFTNELFGLDSESEVSQSNVVPLVKE